MIWRVRDRAEIAALHRTRRHRAGPITVSIVCSPTPSPPRVAYAVGRTVGTAVQRNRVRRRLRASVQELEAELRPGCAYLIGAGPASINRAQRDLVSDLRALFARIQVEGA